MRSANFLVVGIDGSEASIDAAWWAMKNAKSTGIEVRLAAVVDEHFVETAEERLDALADTLAEQAPDATFTTFVTTGDPTEVLVDLADGAKLLVIGAHGEQEEAPGRLGTVSGGIPGHALSSVMILRSRAGEPRESEVPEGHPGTVLPVVAGLDTSAYSAVAALDAALYARVLGVPLHVIVVTPDADPGEHVTEQIELDLAWLRSSVTGVEIRAEHVAAGERSAADILIERSREASVLAVGKRGLGRFESIRTQLGRTSARVLVEAESSVLFVPYRDDRRLENRREAN